MVNDLIGCKGIGIPGAMSILDQDRLVAQTEGTAARRIHAVFGLQTGDNNLRDIP
jgi:hypothetical protein